MDPAESIWTLASVREKRAGRVRGHASVAVRTEVLVVRLSEAFDLLRILVSGGVITAAAYGLGRVALEWQRGKNRVAEIEAESAAELAKIEANSAAKCAEIEALREAQLALEGMRKEQSHRQLDRPRSRPLGDATSCAWTPGEPITWYTPGAVVWSSTGSTVSWLLAGDRSAARAVDG